MVGASLVASLVTRVVLFSGQSTAHGVSAPLRVKRSGQQAGQGTVQADMWNVLNRGWVLGSLGLSLSPV